MNCNEINIRDPFVLYENGQYYMYGSRAKNFAMCSGGFDVYVSADLENWSEPKVCFNSEAFDLNNGANWAPEVHKYDWSVLYVCYVYTGQWFTRHLHSQI